MLKQIRILRSWLNRRVTQYREKKTSAVAAWHISETQFYSVVCYCSDFHYKLGSHGHKHIQSHHPSHILRTIDSKSTEKRDQCVVAITTATCFVALHTRQTIEYAFAFIHIWRIKNGTNVFYANMEWIYLWSASNLISKMNNKIRFAFSKGTIAPWGDANFHFSLENILFSNQNL